MNYHDIIKGSILSEKSYSISEGYKSYTLKVSLRASKDQVRDVLKKAFDVDVVSINTLIKRGKVVKKARNRKGAPIMVKKANFKKAFVTLKDGQEIPFTAIVPNQDNIEEQNETKEQGK